MCLPGKKLQHQWEYVVKKKLTKYDFLAINRRLNQNLNVTQDYCGAVKKITHGEELKLNRRESEGSTLRRAAAEVRR